MSVFSPRGLGGMLHNGLLPVPEGASGSVVECLTRDRGAAGLSLTSVTALWSLSKTHFSTLVLVQPRKTHPCLTERLLMGCKESNQTNQFRIV